MAAEKRINIGQLYSFEGDTYVLAVIDDDNGMALIGVGDGLRWRRAVRVKDTWEVTPDEWLQITGRKVFKFKRECLDLEDE